MTGSNLFSGSKDNKGFLTKSDMMVQCLRYNFFLGGYDAEMAEIKKILEDHGEIIIDRNLQWGAKLSSYKTELKEIFEDEKIIPVFIELQTDIPYPERTIIVDHHNEKAGKNAKTSIEQIALLLEIKLTKWQRLISANDRGSIRAMERKPLSGSKEEIQQVRAFDRKMQGVSPQDELLAEKSIDENLFEYRHNIAIIESLTERTSIITDILYDRYAHQFEHVFIITPDDKFLYSGKGEMTIFLNDFFKKQNQKCNSKNKLWYGGELPDYGFFGWDGGLTILQLEEILDYLNHDIISQHIFMFPFRIVDKNSVNKNQNEKKRRESRYSKIIESFLNSGWKYSLFDPQKNPDNYNQYAYFHDYVREAIFQQTGDDEEKLLKKAGKKPHDIISCALYRKIDEKSLMEISIKGNETPYKLKIDAIDLRIFEAEIGILSITLLNMDNDKIEDILKINDFGRRIYPQFLPVSAAKGAFLPEKVDFTCVDIDSKELFNNKTGNFIDKVSHKDNEAETFEDHNLPEYNIKSADYILQLLGTEFIEKYNFAPLIDDRMYTVCWYGSNFWSNKITNNYKNPINFNVLDKWYQFLFVDGSSAMCSNKKMQKELIEAHTYRRWINDKDDDGSTFLGITRYSFMCLSYRNEFSYDVLRTHMRTVYRQIATITLAQRAILLKFSRDVSDISSDIEIFVKAEKENEGKKQKNNLVRFSEIDKKVKKLHSAYIRFRNRLWFSEVTPQDQGIELYEMAVNHMQIKDQVIDLKNEIKELYEFVDMNYEKTTMKKINMLTVLTAIFLPATLLTGLWGMNLEFTNNLSKFLADFIKAVPNEFVNKFPSWPVSLAIFSYIGFAGYMITKKLLDYIEDNENTTIIDLISFKLFKTVFCNRYMLVIVLVVVIFTIFYFMGYPYVSG